jgi:hypothetical protein
MNQAMNTRRRSPAPRLVAYGLILAAAFGVGAAAGAAFGPDGDAPTPTDVTTPEAHGGDHGGG